MLERGADPLVKGSMGRLALRHAEYQGHTNVVEPRPQFFQASDRRGLTLIEEKAMD
jgi:hypothetical protein